MDIAAQNAAQKGKVPLNSMIIHMAQDNGTGGTSINNLSHRNASLQGIYKVTIISFYANRGNFVAKNELLYISSPQLFGKGNVNNLIAIHDKPVFNDTPQKEYMKFDDDFSFVAHLKGSIDIAFVRNSGNVFQRALLVLHLEKLSE